MVFQPKRKARRTSDSSSAKRRKLCKIDEVPTDILKSIFKRLDFIDIVRAKAVCSSWNLLGAEFVSEWTPLLTLPSKEDVEEGDGTEVDNNAYSGFLKLGATQICSFKRTPKELRDSCCIGSSKGWLVFLGEKAAPFLFHPLRQAKIQLPSFILNNLQGLQKMERNTEGEYEVQYFCGVGSSRRLITACGLSKQELRNLFIQKAVVMQEPDCNNENYSVILLCKDGRIVCHKRGETCWTQLLVYGSYMPKYQDIISWGDNYFSALSHDGNIIDIWDFQEGCVRKTMSIFPGFPGESVDKAGASLGHPYTTRLYLVESCGEILLVVRFIGEFVDSNGELFDDGDDDCIRPYRTCLFQVYKLDAKELKWVEMEALGDQALFVGGNQSASVSIVSADECLPNSIYYTDDYWDRMEEDYLYGGHDMGLYNLKDKSVKPIYEFYSDKIQPPPCWIIPTPKPN